MVARNSKKVVILREVAESIFVGGKYFSPVITFLVPTFEAWEREILESLDSRLRGNDGSKYFELCDSLLKKEKSQP